MKKTKRLAAMFLSVVFSVLLCLPGEVKAAEYGYGQIDANARERYILGVAAEEGISYYEAVEEVSTMEKSIVRAYDEYVRYKTVDKSVGTIRDGSQVIARVRMAVEVCYVYNRATGRAVSIQSVGSPYAYIEGASQYTFNHSDYNVSKISSSKYRISVTGNFTFAVDMGVSVGGDVISISSSQTNFVNTKAKSFVLNLSLSDG